MTEDLRTLTADLGRHAWSLAAIALAAERGALSAIAAGPCTVDDVTRIASIASPTARALVDTLVALGIIVLDGEQVRDAGPLAAFRDPSAGRLLAADIRSTLGTTRDTAYAAESADPVEGWRAIDPVAVRAQGIVSHAMTLALAPLLKSMPDLHERLSAPGARFLDVGAGAAGLGIAYATLYPTLHVVGLEPSEVACAEARRAIDAAGLAERVEVRRAFGQDLEEAGAFTAAYVAQMFIPNDGVDAVWQATARALAPGAWLTTGTIAVDGSDAGAARSVPQRALGRRHTTCAGGDRRSRARWVHGDPIHARTRDGPDPRTAPLGSRLHLASTRGARLVRRGSRAIRWVLWRSVERNNLGGCRRRAR